jgi:hypothetical protein
MDGDKVMEHISKAMRSYLEGRLQYHIANWNTFVKNPVGVAEHGNFMETLEKELEAVAKYKELLDALDYVSGTPGNLPDILTEGDK